MSIEHISRDDFWLAQEVFGRSCSISFIGKISDIQIYETEKITYPPPIISLDENGWELNVIGIGMMGYEESPFHYYDFIRDKAGLDNQLERLKKNHFYFVETDYFQIMYGEDSCVYLNDATFTPILNYTVNKPFEPNAQAGYATVDHKVHNLSTKAPIIQLSRIADVSNVINGQMVQFCGDVSALQTRMTLRNKKMAFATLSDDSGSVSLVLWPDIYLATSYYLLVSKEPVFIVGKVYRNADGVLISVDEIKSVPGNK